MNDDKQSEDALLKFYAMLVDQLHKNSTLLWQIPTALFVANAFVLDRLATQPWLVFFCSLFDFAMAYACWRVRVTQRAIIAAVKCIEGDLCNTSYKKFTPSFAKSAFSAPDLIVLVLFVMSASLFTFSLYSLCSIVF